MKLEKIITQANSDVRLYFAVLERSLRASGCVLPILVIPYDDKIFDLPQGSSWWSMPKVFSWLKAKNTHPGMRKYQCLTTSNYQFVDSDICFLRNPQKVLEDYQGFETCCGHFCETQIDWRLDLEITFSSLLGPSSATCTL